MPLLSTIGAAAARAFGFLRSLISGYNVANSLRFNSGSSDYLNRTPATTTNQRTYTISCWYKRTNTGLQSAIIGVNPAGSPFFSISIDASGTYANKLVFYWYDGTTDYGYSTDMLFRDFSAWYHIVIAVDTTQATSGDRLKVYVNGIQQTLTAVYGSFTQNLDTYYNSNVAHYIGANAETGTPAINGYLSEFYSIDGQALTPSSFGETDTLTGIWKPKAYTGSFGTNGFYLKFANSAALGTDSSPYNMLTAQTDGTTNGIQRGADLTGIANGKTGTTSMWCNFTASSSGAQVLWSSRDNAGLGTTFTTTRTTLGNFQSIARNSAGTIIMQVSTSNTPLSSSGFYHIYFSWDLAVTNKAYLYINGSSVALTYTTFTNDTIQYSVPNHGLAGVLLSPFSPSTPAMFGQVYINYSTYLDPVTNIDKFYGGTSTPVSIGSSGSIPSGSSPIVYLDGNATGILVNRGTGGNFSAFGTLATGTTYSGTGNNINTFTVNNLTSVDQSTDTPTNNFATLNPLLYSTSISYTEGNLKFTNTSAGGQRMVASSIAPTTGKWYAECRVTSLGGAYPQIGVLDTSIYTMDTYVGALVRGYGYASHGQVYNNAGALTTGLATYTTNDIIGVALDLTNNYVYFSKNGTFINSGVPTSGSSGTGGWAITDGYDYSFGSSSLDSGTDPVFDWNFGSPFYAGGSNTDGAGFGNFSYAVPSGYYSLNTKNLANFG